MNVGRVVQSVAGPTAFGVAAIVGARMEPDYCSRDEPISALASKGSPAAKVMVPGFLGLAAGTAELARHIRGTPIAPSPVPSLLSLAAVTTAGAGLARCSDRTCPTRWLGDLDASPADDLHGMFSLATFMLWILIPLIASVRATDADGRYRAQCRGLGVATLIALVTGGALTTRPSRRGSGWAQRVTIALAFGWFGLAGVTSERSR